MLNVIKEIIERSLKLCKITSNNWYDFLLIKKYALMNKIENYKTS